ncbi:39S ribosomal protein L38, mitochondrial-like [Stegodyphus dumicola]|uniref:39S ribosomal protein L38, mitochondrial-like n=1 Tax=Stegodyphus dumicola TaxID=202533 RepID=UPI0015A90B33|nr:39S ribosomal protein L38, mitochondrial-like [Stegodyphus dumicola]
MSGVVVISKSAKCVATRKHVRDIFFTASRSYFKNSRMLGYYFKRLPVPVYKKRQENYRENVLRPLEEILSLKERLAELNAPDPVLDAKVDIGLPKDQYIAKVTLKDRLEWRKRISEENRMSTIDGEIVKPDLTEIMEDWQKRDGITQLQNIADHYGIFSHLYEHGYFTPCVPLNIQYDYDEESASPVYMGNILQASETQKVPSVSFSSNPDDLWTLVLTNLDGHLLDTNAEYLHWFVGNIKGNELQSGEVICDYLQPFPMRGTGYHRLVFVLYKQDKTIDYSSLKKTTPCLSLKERTFKTFNFYKDYQDVLTPAGLAFFQCTWDETLTDFFHNVLNMREPVFEYMEPPLYIKPQEHYPHLQPFNLYLDRYRDPKEIKKEVLLKRLKSIHPFKEETVPKYPCLHKPDDYKFSWQRQDKLKERLRLGKYRDLRPHSVYPQEDNRFPYWTKA